MPIQLVLPNTKHLSHSNRGRELEDMLARTHHYYQIKKTASIRKNPKEWGYAGHGERNQILRSGTRSITALTDDGRVLVCRKSNVDFSGSALSPTGRGINVTFDAKQTAQKRFDLNLVKSHQLQILMEAEMAGSVSGLMIYLSAENRVFFASAGFVFDRTTEMLVRCGAKSISLADLEKHALEIPIRDSIIDWYSVLIDKKRKIK